MAQPVAPNLNINIDPSRYKANLLNAQQIADLWGWQNAESYANQNADQKFNAKKDGIETQQTAANRNFQDASRALDLNYWQDWRGQREKNASSGINAGLAEQRMASVDMNMQNNVGKLYTGLNNTTSDLNKQLARAGEDRTVDYKNYFDERQGFLSNEAYKKFQQEQQTFDRQYQIDLAKEQARVDSERANYENSLSIWKMEQENAQKAMDRAAEEKKWQAQLQLQRDQMAAQQAARSFTPYSRSYTPYQKRSYSGGGGGGSYGMVQSKATPVYEGLTRGQVADSERLAAKVRDPYQNAMANVPKSEPYRPSSSSSKSSSGGGSFLGNLWNTAKKAIPFLRF